MNALFSLGRGLVLWWTQESVEGVRGGVKSVLWYGSGSNHGGEGNGGDGDREVKVNGGGMEATVGGELITHGTLVNHKP